MPILSESAARRMTRAIRRVEGTPVDSPPQPLTGAYRGLRILIVRTPSGGIPAAAGSTPGSESCRLRYVTDDGSLADWTDNTSAAVDLTVHNLAGSAVSGSIDVLACQELLSGKLVAMVGGGGDGVSLALAQLNGGLSPSDAAASVDNLEALGGGAAPSISSAVNSLFKLAGRDNDYVLLARRAGNSTWLVAQVTHQVATLVLNHSDDGVFLTYNADDATLDGCVIAASIVSGGEGGYQTQMNVHPCG